MKNNPHPESAVAIIGMACRLPGANSLDEFWDLLREGRTAWGPIPGARFDRSLYFHPEKGTLTKSYSDLAALVDYREVDRTICPISDTNLAVHDVAHVTLCEVAAAACRHAGYAPAELPYENTGVYIGHAAASGAEGELTFASNVRQTANYLRDVIGFDDLGTGVGETVIEEIVDAVRRARPYPQIYEGHCAGASYAARLIAETFALNGPCMSFNAACASSSRALAQAVRALQLRNIDMAIAGGASFFHSDTLVLFSQSHALSATGSSPFSAHADGMVAGEGYVVLLLKMLDRAVADNDHILAVVPGVGLSSDGHGKSLWAPRFEGQVKAIERAYGPHVPMSQLDYIEAHATSTSLGDITEVKALTLALQGQLPPGKKLPAGSAKLNVGHTLESAGLVGVLKTVLALQHEWIPPAIGNFPLNPEIDWETAPIFVSREGIAWPKKKDSVPRRAGVNAFGIGGLNVHVVVDGFVPSRTTSIAVGQRPPRTPTVAIEPRREDDAVAIIGMGAVMPGALTRAAFWELLRSGRDPKVEVPPNRWDAEAFCRPDARAPWETPTALGGFVTGFEYDWRKHKIPPKQLQQASPLQFMILDAVDQAIEQANYHHRPFNRQQVGVVVGTVFGGDYSSQLLMGLRLPEFLKLMAENLRRRGVAEPTINKLSRSYTEILLKRMPALLDETGSFTASALASRITKSFDLMGGAVAVDAGQASALAALSCCIDQLRSGEGEMMICVGGESDMTPRLYADLMMMGRLAGGSVRSPFDARADGHVPGEGCGALLLKRLADARRDNDPILGIIRGVGAAYEQTADEAANLAISRALHDGGLRPADVGAIEIAASGELNSDMSEIQGIVDAYRHRGSAPRLVMGTAVGQIGHMSGASGMVSLLKASLEIENAAMLPDAGLEKPAPHITRHSTVLTIPNGKPVTLAGSQEGRLIAGVHSGGTREVAYHVLLERATKLKANELRAPNMKPLSAKPSVTPAPRNDVVEFDATARRREKKRGVAAGARIQQQPDQSPVKTVASPRVTQVVRSQEATMPQVAQQPVRPVRPQVTTAVAPVPPQRSSSPTVSSATSHSPAKSNGDAAAHSTRSQQPARLSEHELEKFLINFVVEQTGYPPEIVELDADLEADLGIDSIKKAQLFGELGEYFEVQPAENTSLDDFPTLRHVLAVLVNSQNATSNGQQKNAEAPTTVAAVAPKAAPKPVAASQPSSPANHTYVKPNGAMPESVMAPSSNPSQLNPIELEKFLINFVVEQTGYPPEIVELDADLEADLGIDSIKKAQLFAELAEYFEIQPSENMSLDDFPTLRHVLAVLLTAQTRETTTTPASAPAAHQTETTPTRAAIASKVGASTRQPAPVAAQPEIKPDYAHTRGKTNGASVTPERTAPGSDATRLDAADIEKFLINFVVEQTGYPPEIVELDADLEADLGIDSIKKAQLFGELGEYFEVRPAENTSLDDFPTLRHVLAVLIASQNSQPVGGA